MSVPKSALNTVPNEEAISQWVSRYPVAVIAFGATLVGLLLLGLLGVLRKREPTMGQISVLSEVDREQALIKLNDWLDRAELPKSDEVA